MKPTLKVCITCVGNRLGYDVANALRAAKDFDLFLIGTDANSSAAGRLLCDHFAQVPLPEINEERYIAEILNLNDTIGIDVFITLSEGECRAVARHRSELEAQGIKCSVSSIETVKTMTDKLLMLQCLQANGIDPGKFLSIETASDADIAIKKLGYPNKKVVIKPRGASGSRGVLIADSQEETFKQLLPDRFCGTGSFRNLTKAMATENMDFKNLIAVPFYNGPVFDVDCISVSGELTDIAARLRQLKNPLWPTSTGHKISMDKRVIDFARKLCSAFRVEGAGDFDIVLENGEIPRLLDSGARFSGSVGGSFIAGANFPAQLVRILAGLPRQKEVIENGVILRPYITMARIPEINEKDFL